MKNKRQKQAKILRVFRKIHRSMGILLFVFFFVISATGGLLGWKKNSADLILPKNYIGSTTNLQNWLPIRELQHISDTLLTAKVETVTSLELNRIDIRAEKGLVKFIYKGSHWEVQLDGATGKLLNIAQRKSDLIENIHDGSILDTFFDTDGIFKLIYTTIMGTSLLLFTITGFWLWLGPKRMRKNSKKRLT